MVLDTCEASGEEHELSRETKCKGTKAKVARKVKLESPEDEVEQGEETLILLMLFMI